MAVWHGVLVGAGAGWGLAWPDRHGANQASHGPIKAALVIGILSARTM